MENKCGQRIKQRLEDLDMSQADLCRKTGINSATISQYISGKYYPTQKRLELIAAALKASPMYIMGWTDELISFHRYDDTADIPASGYSSQDPDSNNDAIGKIIGIMLDLDDAGQEQLINYGRFLLEQKEK